MKIKSIVATAAMIVATTTVTMAQKVILPDFHADPSVHYWDGKYWMYPSTDEPGSKSWAEMKQWHAYSSSNLTDWKCEGKIFSLEDISWADDCAFAPDAVKWKGKYYFVFPASKHIGIAVADNPSGPFKDAIGKPLIKDRQVKGVSSFDPCLFVDDDHTPYIYYGGAGGCAVAKMKDNMTELDGEITKLPLTQYAEGIWVFKRNHIYYFTYPNPYKDKEGNTKQLLVYSTAPTPMGPFTFRGSFLDNKSRNSHHSFIKAEDDKWYLFYHIQGPSPYERRVCVDYVEFNDEGLIKEVKMSKKGVKPLAQRKPLE